jgi:predicted dehydrogenase
MDKKTYSIALIGCGHMGQAHIEDIFYREKVSVEYVCDLDENKAKLFFKKIRCS